MDHEHMTMATSTSTAMSGMTTTASGDMASSTGVGTADSSEQSMMMSSADMAMVFFQSVTTPLYAYGWTPAGQGSYAGTCVFLIALGLVHRVLIALRFAFFDSNPSLQRHHHKLEEDAGGSPASVSPSRRLRFQWNSHPFRVATETSRALFEVFIGGVGYLLMLAVMTMNVGYFLSVLGGIFLGAFVAGRFKAVADHH